MDSSGINFELQMDQISEFAVGVNSPNQVYVDNPGSPEVRFVSLDGAPKASLLQVKVTSSSDDVCGLISIQPYTCPVLDMEETVRSRGAYQTISRLAAFNFQRKTYEVFCWPLYFWTILFFLPFFSSRLAWIN